MKTAQCVLVLLGCIAMIARCSHAAGYAAQACDDRAVLSAVARHLLLDQRNEPNKSITVYAAAARPLSPTRRLENKSAESLVEALLVRRVVPSVLPREIVNDRVTWFRPSKADSGSVTQPVGVYALTYPGYSATCNQALVEVTWSAGPLAMEREFVLLERGHAGWVVAWSDIDFIS